MSHVTCGYFRTLACVFSFCCLKREASFALRRRRARRHTAAEPQPQPQRRAPREPPRLTGGARATRTDMYICVYMYKVLVSCKTHTVHCDTAALWPHAAL